MAMFNRPPNQLGRPQRPVTGPEPPVFVENEDGVMEARPYDWKMTAMGGAMRAGKSMVEDVRSGKPLNATKATIAAVGEDNYNLAKGAVNTGKQLVKGKKPMKDEPMTDPSSGGSSNGKKPGRRGRRGRGKGGNRGGGGDNSRMYTGNENNGIPSNKLSSVTPYAVTLPGTKIDISTPMDGSLYYLPYETQSANASDVDEGDYGICSVKTSLRIIDMSNPWYFAPSVTTYTNDMLTDAAYRIYSELKMQVNSNTNGGNAVTRHTFTYENFWNYISAAVQGHAMLCEIESRMTWSPEVNESNLIARDMKNMMTGDPDLFVQRNRLRDSMSTMALPKTLMMYYLKIFANYKKSPVMGGPLQIYMTNVLCEDMCEMTNGTVTDPFIQTKLKINVIIDQIRANMDEWSQITALLIDKTDFDYVSQRYRQGALPYPCYDDVQNGIFNNLPFHFQLGDGSLFDAFGRKQLTVTNTEPTIALPMDPSSVPIYLTAHLMQLFTGGSFPFFRENDQAYTSPLELSYASNMVAQTDVSTTNPYGFTITCENRSQTQATDHMVTLVTQDTPADLASVVLNIIPKGLNVRRYQPSFDSVSTACVQFMYTCFGVAL